MAKARKGTLAPAIEMMLWHYSKGKPKEHFELTGDMTMTGRRAQAFEAEARRPTLEELDGVPAKLKAHNAEMGPSWGCRASYERRPGPRLARREQLLARHKQGSPFG